MFKECMTTLAVTDLERAKKFYTKEVGLKEVGPMMPEGGDLLLACGDNKLYLYQRDQPSGSTATACSLEVDDLEATVRRMRDNGVRFEDYDLPGLKTENGIAETGPAKTAWFKDPDGNIIAISDTIRATGTTRQVQSQAR